MKRLSDITPEELGGGINLLDLGARGEAPPSWRILAHLTNLIAFDLDKDECDRLRQQNSGFHSQTYLPYAIAGSTGEYSLYKTQNKYCWSLLEPDLDWLRRFTFSDNFEIAGAQKIHACSLSDVDELKDIDIDAMKMDTQGMELPILASAGSIVDRCILIETETGVCESYRGETTFDQILHFMRSKGFGLFHLNSNHKVAKRNRLASFSANEQILWCEAIWLRDFASPPCMNLTREKALKALCIFAALGCCATGLEAAQLFHKQGILQEDELESLSGAVSFWQFPPPKRAASITRSAARFVLDLVPRRFYTSIALLLEQLSSTLHPIHRITGK